MASPLTLTVPCVRLPQPSPFHSNISSPRRRTRQLIPVALLPSVRRSSQFGSHANLLADSGVPISLETKLRISGLPNARRRAPRSHLLSGISTSAAAVAAPVAAPSKSFDNSIGLHAMVWVGGWSNEECERAVTRSAAIGYDLIEVPVLDPATVDVDYTRDVLIANGMRASTSLGLSLDKDISNADPDVAKRGEELLLSALSVASSIGASHLAGVTYSAIHKYATPFPGGRAKDNLVGALRRVASRAADCGVVVGVEVVNRYESNVLNTAKQAVDLLHEVDHPNLIIHLDSYHMNIEEGSLADAVAVCGDKLGYVHIGESHRGYLGTGTVDFQQLFRALARADYSGPITFESFSSEVVSPQLSNTLAVWRNLWDDSDDLAQHAFDFMNTQWTAARRAAGPSRK